MATSNLGNKTTENIMCGPRDDSRAGRKIEDEEEKILLTKRSKFKMSRNIFLLSEPNHRADPCGEEVRRRRRPKKWKNENKMN